MQKPKKRPSKAAKAAKRIVAESKLLSEKSEPPQGGSEFKPTSASTHVNKAANKPRPDKKRG